ncbi:discoidin domain-containing protein [Thomasclavelia spiroformis]|uniref:discoidin domain-containing protein n=1 Tax=Thomasclavelia spiroformis TaxID=29348 RepID=UPI00241FAF0A|nr:discoidin domain-containing protein [Thomasclavelia spiroformis]MBS6686416.1 discoidin domain-containing protein [Thomasclavelia spiroformis]
MKKKTFHKISALSLAAMMSLSTVSTTAIGLSAKNSLNALSEEISTLATDEAGYNVLGAVTSAAVDGNKVDLTIETGEKIRFTFLEPHVFRMYMAPEGEEFQEYPTPNGSDHTATITNKTDDQYKAEYDVVPELTDDGDKYTISTDKIKLEIVKETSLMKLMKADGTVVWEEAAPLKYKTGSTVQTLKTNEKEYFFGGGTQNGYFSHKGKSIKIVATNTWVDGSVASPNPFYWSTDGYGVVRNTWKPGQYDFDSKGDGTVTTTHNEKRFDAYYFVDDSAEDILGDYYELTGTPAELPEYASYLGHLNCYNRDYWLEVPEGTSGAVKLGDKWYKESQSDNGGVKETLLGDANTTAQQVIEDHKANDMPLGWFAPNDGYGCGYGQADTQAGDIENLENFADFAIANGVETGLWTQSNLWPADPSNPQKGERDIYKEVEAGVHATKTDVAWVGPAYSFALNGVSVAYDAIASRSGMKPAIVTLDGWAGTQRYGGIWTGDQSGGNWEYIRFHIPTYIGTALSGQPNVGSDMDGIFGGSNKIINTRDFQWKAFTTYMLDMDGWGSNQKTPWALGDDVASINRTYLKLKAQLMPYINTISHEATAEGGLPMLRAMFLEEANDYTLGTATQYQYMWGDNFLVAPIYQDTASDGEGNDIRNDIYLPGTSDVWIDYFTGKQYRGGQVLNNFDAPLWKLPVFVKNGAIIPMYPENNNPEALSETNTDGLDRTQRIVEFYPSGSTQFEAYEDDGKTLGGASSTTLITSDVKDGTATLKAEKAVGSYTGMVKERSTEFVVNVSKAPTKVTGNVAGEDVTFTEVHSQEEYDAAEGNVYFYNPAPSVMVKDYANEGTKYAEIEDTTTPKLYVKSAEKVDITEYDFTVNVEGFENTQDLGEDIEDSSVAVPTNFVEQSKTDSEITLDWDDMKDAVSYDIEVDGTVYRNILDSTYTHSGLKYLTNHTYRVRTVRADGHYSEWSELLTIQTDDNPYRNVPDFTAEWEYGDGWGALEDAFDHNTNTMFHSTNAVTPDQMMTLDLGAAYQLDKLTYQPRMDNKGNGTVTRMDVYASLDGINYTKVWDGKENAAWTYSSDMADPDIKEVTLNGVKARYLKLSVLESKGGFFSASEITPYKLDGTNAWVVGDVNNSGTVDNNDLTFYENYVGLKPIDNDWEYSTLGNIDNNQIIDAYDISFVARMLGDEPVDPAQAAEGVEGKIEIVPSKTDIKAGDEVTLDFYGIGLKNVNAFSVEMPVDTSLFEVTNFGSASLSTVFMRNFSKTRFHNDGSVDNYVCFANEGTQELINGTGSLAKVTIRATEDFTWDTKATQAVVVGQDLSKADALIDITQEPTAPETKYILQSEDIASITFDNDVKQDMDGSELWHQSNWRELLFDGDKSGSALAEFKWYLTTYPETGDIPAEVKLPTDMDFTFNKAEPLKTIKVYNRESSNGRVTSIKATAYSGDTAYDLGQIDSAQDVFEFTVPEEAASIDRVVITPLTSTGTATGTTTGSEANRMLSLREIEFETDSAVKATGIGFDEASADSVYVGALAEVSATVAPDNATNPFYEITSSDENIAKVIKIPMEDKYIYAIQGISEGTVTLTATSEDGQFTATKEFKVVEGVDTTVLQQQIDEFEALYENLYTTESYAKAKAAVDAAKELIVSEDATQSAVDKATIDIVNAVNALEFKGSNTDQPSSENLIPQDTLKRYDESSMSAAEKEDASYTIDGKTDTIWHSNYNSGYTLPQYVTIDLGAVYDLEQVNMLPRQNSHNGHITHYRIEVSTDGTTFTPVVEGYLENDGNSLIDPGVEKEIKFDTTKAQYVRFIAIESLGDRNNAYASIAELNFYGTTESGEVETVNKAALEAAVTTANALKEQGALDNVIPAVVAEFNAALAEAEGILADSNADQVTVDASFFRLATAIQMVDFVKGDKTELTALIEEYSKLEESNYTTDSWKVFKEALDAAIAVNEDENALEYEVKDALNNLKDGYAQLVLVADKSALQSMVDRINGLEEELYTPESWAKLADPMKVAQGVLDNPAATQDEVNAAYEALVRAYLDLRLIPNKDLLEDLINKAQSFEAANYTADSYANLRSALLVAQSTLANESADEAAVKAAVEGLQASIDALVLVSADNNVASGDKVNAGDKTAIATGDSTSMLSSIAGLALASIAMFGAKRRKKSK